MKGYSVKATTTSESRFHALRAINVEPFILDIENIPVNIQSFLQSNILIVNIPSKNIKAFSNLLKEIENSSVNEVIFVSSTSVYRDNNETISESNSVDLMQCPLHTIEEMFRNCGKIKTTIIRFGGLIGYSRHPGKFFGSGRIVKNPDANVNLIHRDDCIGIITKILENEVWNEVFNCCADTHPTKREFYTQTAHSIGQGTPNFESSNEIIFKIMSNVKVKKLLNYKFLHPDLMKIKFT